MSASGVNSFLKLRGQVVMRRNAAVWRRLLFCQKYGGAIVPPPFIDAPFSMKIEEMPDQNSN